MNLHHLLVVVSALSAPSLAGAQYRYNGSGGAIQDGMVIGPPNNVPGLTDFHIVPADFYGQIVDARVSLYIVHPAVEELGITLISPAGTHIPLVDQREDSFGQYSNNIGAAGADFGVGCRDSQRTTFSDGVGAQIPAALAPYVGTFIPVYPYKLAALDGTYASTVNGTWSLEISDSRYGNTGTLYCWSLMLDSTDLVFRDGFGG